MSDTIAENRVGIALIERETDGVLADVVLLKPASIRRLKDQPISAVAAIVDEPVTANQQLFRKHDGGTRGVLRESVTLEPISVGIHVMQAISRSMDEVAFNSAIIRERKVDSVARIADLVSANQVSFRIPLMNPVAASIRNKRGVAILAALPDSFLNRIAGGSEGCLALNAVI